MGGALIGISAACAVLVNAKTAAARPMLRMACPLESLRITNDYTRTPLRNMLPAGHTGKKSGKLCISAPGRPYPPARRAPAGAPPPTAARSDALRSSGRPQPTNTLTIPFDHTIALWAKLTSCVIEDGIVAEAILLLAH